MTTLLDLQPEILENILSEITAYRPRPHRSFGPGPKWADTSSHRVVPWEHIRSLAEISLTCRQLRKVAEPIIWRHLWAIRGDEWFIRLLRLWESRPDLARSVRTFTIFATLNHGCKDMVTADGRSFLVLLAERFGVDLTDDWYNSDETPSVLAVLALLCTAQLRAVELVGSEDLDKFIPSPERTPVRLSSLKHIRCGFASVMRTYTSHFHKLVALSSNFNTFEAGPGVCVVKEDSSIWSNVTRLAFLGPEIDTENLVGIIGACRQLRRFEFRAFQVEAEDIGKEEVSHSSVIAALADKHARTLTELRLGFVPMKRSWIPPCSRQTGPLGSLSAFTNLEALMLLGPDLASGGALRTIPQSLRVLGVCLSIRDIREEFEWLAAERQAGSFPHLCHVGLDPWQCPHMQNPNRPRPNPQQRPQDCPYDMRGKSTIDLIESSKLVSGKWFGWKGAYERVARLLEPKLPSRPSQPVGECKADFEWISSIAQAGVPITVCQGSQFGDQYWYMGGRED
ncbi:hypothetical protein CPLU01_06034 [Colletotrichum plurivorum]|uniref:F-box domain-containing protein n=1 Tax=Colletotrichum plurivorum TaxID=2175906 RepID=A0A8H6NH37_9PEZI|nr:hypothetical protein CPLU01_06034 [Colletotrichum plurivorum]